MGYESMLGSVTGLVRERFSEHVSESVYEYAVRRTEDLIRENEADSEDLRPHSYDYIYPAIGLYEGMKAAGICTEDAVDVIREHFRITCAVDNARYRKWLRIPGLYHLVSRRFLSYSMKNYPESAGYGYRIPEKINPREGRYDMIRCPYVDILRKYGCFEVCSAFCDSDDVTYGDLHPKLEWARTKSMGNGGDCCDFCIREK